jgi:hypothetical protein
VFKVLFYHANDCLTSNSNIFFIGLASIYLKTHLEITYPEIGKKVEWLLPLQEKLSDNDLINYCNEVKPDLLCTSHYLWNHTFLMEQLSRVKTHIPVTTKIACGGPSIDANINQDFFNKFPFIDYAIYGAGEQSFSDIIISLINKIKLIKFNTSNIAWFNKEKQITEIADFKYVPQHKVSPFLHNKEMFTAMINTLQEKNIEIIVPYELTRGCPYSCTFCDWNSGLSNKVTRRKGTYKEEINLFQELGVNKLYLADANVGQYDEDIEMIAYLVEKNINENANFKVDGNYSKLKKENNLKIFKLLGKGNLISGNNHYYGGFTISVQDINPAVLDNIDRPDVGWNEHLTMIEELNSDFPNMICKVQLIQGLPGQTVESWRNTLAEICKHKLILQPFISELLPASPAALDKNYQDKFKFNYTTAERYESGIFLRGNIVASCFSFTKIDFVRMTILTRIYYSLMLIKNTRCEFVVEEVVNRFLESKIYKSLVENLYDNWINKDKFYFTIDLDGNENIVSASQFVEANLDWCNSNFLLNIISKHTNKKDFINFFNYYKRESKNLPLVYA